MTEASAPPGGTIPPDHRRPLPPDPLTAGFACREAGAAVRPAGWGTLRSGLYARPNSLTGRVDSASIPLILKDIPGLFRHGRIFRAVATRRGAGPEAGLPAWGRPSPQSGFATSTNSVTGIAASTSNPLILKRISELSQQLPAAWPLLAAGLPTSPPARPGRRPVPQSGLILKKLLIV